MAFGDWGLSGEAARWASGVGRHEAEAWRKRRYPASFASKLSDADAEAAECQVWVAFAHQCGYLTAEQQSELSERQDHVCSQLSIMIRDADRWAQTPPSAPRGNAPRSTLPRSTEQQ